MKKLVLVSTLSLLAASSSYAAETCTSEGLAALSQAIANQHKIANVPTAPFSAYNGLTPSQSSSLLASGSGVTKAASALIDKLTPAVTAFINTNGDAGAAATKLFGSSSRRQTVEVFKRDANGSPASVDARCGSGNCQDIALEITSMHMAPAKTAQAVMDSISARKFSSIKPAVVTVCETGGGCVSKNDLTLSNSKVRQSQTMSALRVGTQYTAREIATSPIGTIDNTSLYKITPLQICGHSALLLSGISTRDANSFSNASSDLLVVEAGSRVLTITVAQGMAIKGSSVQSMFLHPLFGGRARGTFTKGYNETSERLGTGEIIDGDGRLQ